MELLKFSEVQAIPEERWTTFLFGYRKKLLDAARDNSYLRDHVFQNRDAIAQVFYAFGGELLEETGNTFLHLESADELLNYCEEKPAREAARETAKKEHWTGYHVLSDEELSPMQIQHIRDCTKTGFKVGKPNDISFNQLLYLEERDKRPIYIEGALTQDLVYQLEYLFVFQPYLKEKTYWLDWNETGVNFRPISDAFDQFPVDRVLMSPVQLEQLRKFIYLEPEIGGVYQGKIESFSRGGVWVRLSPRFIGLLSSQRSDGEEHQVGESIMVKCVDVVVTKMGARIFLESCSINKNPGTIAGKFID